MRVEWIHWKSEGPPQEGEMGWNAVFELGQYAISGFDGDEHGRDKAYQLMREAVAERVQEWETWTKQEEENKMEMEMEREESGAGGEEMTG